MRALRLGDAAIADDVAAEPGVGAQVARDVVRECLETGGDCRVEVDDVRCRRRGTRRMRRRPAPTKRMVTVTHAQVEAAQTAFLQRLARELVRYLTSSGKASRIKALWITGGASRTPGIREMLEEVFSTEPRELDLLGRLQHELDAEQVAALGPSLATAIGLALTKLGGPTGFDLRQEDLSVHARLRAHQVPVGARVHGRPVGPHHLRLQARPPKLQAPRTPRSARPTSPMRSAPRVLRHALLGVLDQVV
jgi:cell division ATPase FtsA